MNQTAKTILVHLEQLITRKIAEGCRLYFFKYFEKADKY